jgi:hypothetical protein
MQAKTQLTQSYGTVDFLKSIKKSIDRTPKMQKMQLIDCAS